MKRAYRSTFALLVAASAYAQQQPSTGFPRAEAEGQPTVTQQQPAPLPALAPNQLDDLVAPIALYPDPLLSQILVASTYPLELVEASQWMARNPGVTGPAVTQAAQQQNWDPSIQALVVFPDLVKRLTQDVTWTTNLGNAFLAQESDVMDAVQRMRQRAQQNGKLSSSSQQTVTVNSGAGPAVIQIMPADPQVIYVPTYDPVAIYGPSAYYPYPYWNYPTYYSGGPYFSFGFGINVGSYFGGGWGGWNSWGWMPGWSNRSIIINNGFLSRYNFNGYRGGAYGYSAWAHSGIHRLGVPYASPSISARYRIAPRQFAQTRAFVGGYSSPRAFSPRAGGFRAGARQGVPNSGWNNRSFGGGFSRPGGARFNGGSGSYRGGDGGRSGGGGRAGGGRGGRGR